MMKMWFIKANRGVEEFWKSFQHFS